MEISKLKCQAFVKKFKNELLIFFALFFFNSLLSKIAGAPWEDLDGKYYFFIANNFFDRFLFRSSWQPLGFSFFMLPFAALKISIFWVPILLSTVNQFLISKLFPGLKKRYAFLLLLIFWIPEWLYMGLTTLTENLFLTILLLSLHVLDSKMMEGRRKLLYLGILFGSLVWTRHAGLFFYPAYIVAGILVVFKNQIRFRVILSLGWGLFLIAAIGVSNLINSGNPLKPSRGGHACLQMVAAMSALPFCEKSLAPKLCSLDQNKLLNSAKDDTDFLHYMNFEKDSPIVKFVELYGQKELCQNAKKIFIHYFYNEPLFLAKILARKVWKFLGPWDAGFIGMHEIRRKSELATWSMNQVITLAHYWNKVKNVERILLVSLCFMLLAIRFRNPDVTLIFLVLGALGHAFGIVLNNPFYVLRYQSISHSLLLLAVMLGLTWRSRKLENSA